MKKNSFFSQKSYLLLSVLPKPYKPEKRIYDKQQSKQYPVCPVNLQGKILPKNDGKSQCEIKAEHKKS